VTRWWAVVSGHDRLVGEPGSALGVARDELAGAVADLADDLAQVAEVLTSELVAEALDQGRGPVTLRVRRGEDTLGVEVVDPAAEVPLVREHVLTSVSGRGLQLVDALAAAWGSAPVRDSGRDCERDGGPGGERASRAVWFELQV
jgi:hypothetical protein